MKPNVDIEETASQLYETAHRYATRWVFAGADERFLWLRVAEDVKQRIADAYNDGYDDGYDDVECV